MLVIIKAEDVRDGEPRWWLGDEESRWDYVKADHLHLSACGDDTATRAIVDRPAPTPAPAPGLDLEAALATARAALSLAADVPPQCWPPAEVTASLIDAAPAMASVCDAVEILRARLAESTAAAVALAAEADGSRAGLARLAGQQDYAIALQRLIETLARGEMPTIDDVGAPHMSRVAIKAAGRLAEAKRLGLEAAGWAGIDHASLCSINTGRIDECNCYVAIRAALEAL